MTMSGTSAGERCASQSMRASPIGSSSGELTSTARALRYALHSRAASAGTHAIGWLDTFSFGSCTQRD